MIVSFAFNEVHYWKGCCFVQNAANVGYAFVNFVHPLFILDFHKEFNGEMWPIFNSKKKCNINYAKF